MASSGSRNVAALLLEKLVTLGGIAAVNVVILRALGPSTYGHLGAATAVLAMCMPLTLFGNMAIVRVLTIDPDKSRALVRLGRILSLVGATAGVLSIAVLAATGALGEESSVLLAILALALFARPLSAVDLWFQATRQNIVASRTRTAVSLLSGVARAVTALTTGSLVLMALVIVLENLVAGIALHVEYKLRARKVPRSEPLPRAERAAIVRTSFTYLMYAMTVIIFMRIDQPMLLAIASSEDVGTYAAAANISDADSFIPTSLLTAVMPILSSLATTDRKRYLAATEQLFGAGAGAGYVVLIAGAGAAPFVIPLLYGGEYIQSVLLLQILLVGVPFLFVGHLRTAHIVNDDLHRETLWVGLLALGVNVSLNLLWIPSFGAIGAAAATSLAHAFNGVIGGLLFRRTRELSSMQLRAMSPFTAFPALFRLLRDRRF